MVIEYTTPPVLTDGESLSHHCTYGSRIQRFVKKWSNFLIIDKHRFVTALLQTFHRDSGFQNGATGNRPCIHSATAVTVCVLMVYTYTYQVFPSSFGFLPLFPDTTSQPVTHPTINIFEFFLNTCQALVLYNTSPKLVPRFKQIKKAYICDMKKGDYHCHSVVGFSAVCRN